MDLLLLSYINSTDESERERLLSEIVLVHVAPLVRRTLRQRLGFYVNTLGVNPHNQDAEDIYHDIVTKIISKLNKSELAAEQNAIKDFRHYVLRLSANACHDYLRAKTPARSHLKFNLWDLLKRHRDFAVRRDNQNNLLCGFAIWQEQDRDFIFPANRIIELLEHPEAFKSAKFAQKDVRQFPLTKIVAELFGWLNHPIELNDLVKVMAVLLEVKDTPHESLDASDYKQSVSVAVADFYTDSQLETKDLLRQLWDEVRRLPVTQRDTFCLGFADENGDDLFTLLIAQGLATPEQLAHEFGRESQNLMVLWQHMPMDNETLARTLGVSRRQVNKWRFRALQRLKRVLRPTPTVK